MRNLQQLFWLLVLSSISLAAAPATHVNHEALKKLSWQLAARGSTFREMTTFDMIDLLHEMGFHHIELSPGQTLSAESKSATIDPAMQTADLDALIAKLKAVKLDIVSYGPADFGTDEASARKVFDFARKLKLKTLITDAPPESLPMLDTLAAEYQINLALSCTTPAHRYTTLDAAMKALSGRSDRITIAAEPAVWHAGGQDVALAIKTLSPHIVLVHLHDVDSGGKPATLGTGVATIHEALAALDQSGFKGICCVQDETTSPEDRTAHFAASINAFSEMLTGIASGK